MDSFNFPKWQRIYPKAFKLFKQFFKDNYYTMRWKATKTIAGFETIPYTVQSGVLKHFFELNNLVIYTSTTAATLTLVPIAKAYVKEVYNGKLLESKEIIHVALDKNRFEIEEMMFEKAFKYIEQKLQSS
jgi:hypothetical protein